MVEVKIYMDRLTGDFPMEGGAVFGLDLFWVQSWRMNAFRSGKHSVSAGGSGIIPAIFVCLYGKALHA